MRIVLWVMLVLSVAVSASCSGERYGDVPAVDTADAPPRVVSFGGCAVERRSALSPVEQKAEEDLRASDRVLLGARDEVRRRVRYDASYVSIDYPGGDVAADVGACTDVVIRAFRNAGIDLQVLIHEDMRENFGLYPQTWGLSSPDRNIDHRRVPNQMRFLERFGTSLTVEVMGHLDQWQWGDVVYWRFPSGEEHCGIVSDRVNARGIPLVIHNAGVAREEDCLLRWEITGHFRYP